MERRRKPGVRQEKPAAQALLDYLSRPAYRPVPQRELLHRMNVSREERASARRLIRRLVEQGRIHKISGGRLVAATAEDVVRGTLQRHREGFGFVVPETGGEDVFIPPRSLGDARSGDKVAVRIQGRSREGRVHGVISAVLEERSRLVLGVYQEQGPFGAVQPFDLALGEPIHVPAAFRFGASDLQVVRVEVLKPPAVGQPPQGKIVEVLGHLDDPGTATLVVIQKFGLATEFPASALEEAEDLADQVDSREIAKRERFDDPAPVTIDGETARDFDDAVAVEQLARGGFRLFVHIADVAHFAPPGSTVDEEARRRGTSVYFPDRVLPMFPEKLSNDLCSLRPGEPRLVQSVILDLTADGEVQSVRFADGVICSAARLTYTAVAAALEGRENHGVPANLLPMLRVAEVLRDRLESRRRARGSIDFDLPEPQILLDVEGAMTGITIEPRNSAHRMIEEFMLAANEAVARHLEDHRVSALFRVHEKPDPLKLAALADFVAHFGLELEAADESVTPADIQRMLERTEGRSEYPVVSQVTLRSMKQARYATENVGHFGLASDTYCHFTSPIRRYPDLVIHRLLRAQRRGRLAAEIDGGSLEGLAESCSELERNAEAAERELLVWKKVAFIAGRVGDTFEGIVTGVTRFGLFVQLTESLVEGLVRVEQLGEERFEFREARYELLGTRTGRLFRLGDRLHVQVSRVDRVLQRVDLSLIDDGAGTLQASAREPGDRASSATFAGRKARRPAPKGRGRRRAGGKR